jgi:hypothetical protein
MGLDSLAQFSPHEYTERKLYAVHDDAPSGNDNPNKWTIDPSGRVLKAGDDFQAAYGPDGEISYAKLGSHEWRKTGPDSYEETNTLSEGWERKKQLDDVSISIYSRIRLKQPDGSLAIVSGEYLKAHQAEKDLPENLFMTIGVDVTNHQGGSGGDHRPLWIGKNWHNEVPLGPRS